MSGKRGGVSPRFSFGMNDAAWIRSRMAVANARTSTDAPPKNGNVKKKLRIVFFFNKPAPAVVPRSNEPPALPENFVGARCTPSDDALRA